MLLAKISIIAMVFALVDLDWSGGKVRNLLVKGPPGRASGCGRGKP